MRYLFHYPEPHGLEADVLDAGPLHDVAAAVECAGFDGISLSEHPAPGARWLSSGGHQTLDPFVALAFAAAATQRLRVVTNIVVAPYRNPLLLAKAAATLDKLSGGRLTLGLGTGYQKSEYYAVGVDMDERNALFDEALEVIPMHWRGEPFNYQGRHFSARDVIARPRPVQDPIPIWIGGNSKLTRRRVAERAHGWMTMSGSAEVSATARTPELGSVSDLAAMIAEVRDAAAAAGRTDVIDVSYSYSTGSIESLTDDADRHQEAIAEIGAAGVTWLIVSAATKALSETREFLEGFGEAYLGS